MDRKSTETKLGFRKRARNKVAKTLVKITQDRIPLTINAIGQRSNRKNPPQAKTIKNSAIEESNIILEERKASGIPARTKTWDFNLYDYKIS